MSDGQSRLAEMEALSAQIDAAQDAGNHSKAQALTAEMMALIDTSLGRAPARQEGLPPDYAALRSAIVTGDLDQVRILATDLDLTLPHGRRGQFPLIWAMRTPHRSPAMISCLLSIGARADQVTPEQDTALHFLADANLEDSGLFALVAIVDLLLQSGGSLGARQHWGWTPLHRAVVEGTTRQLEALLHHGADPNAKLSLGDISNGGLALTPLMVAGAEPDKVQLLLSHGADAALLNSHGQSSVEYLRREAHDADSALAAKSAANRANRFDRDYARGLRRSLELVAGPQAQRH